MRVNVELNAGLHRGGVAGQTALGGLLAPIAIHPQYLEFAGFTGYDPFVGMGVPGVLGSPEELFAKVMALYQGHVDFARQYSVALWASQLTLNTTDGPNCCMYEKETLSNEVSVSTAMFKPNHYDLASLAEHVPAVYIATSILKSIGVVQVPTLDDKPRLFSWWDPNRRGTFLIYGGNWIADFASPEGLRSSGIYGRNSDQEMINGPPSVGLEADDQIFLRPTQGESVLLRFSDLLTLRGG